MVLLAVLSSLIFSSGESFARSFCDRTPRDIQNTFRNSCQRIAFQNQGGFLNKGTCWWHSRLQRAAVYLVDFAPDEPRLGYLQARELVRDLTHFRRVVVIPGYTSFSDFSRDHEQIIQAELNRWQVRDGFINQQWLRGLSGHSSLDARTMRKHMDHLYSQFRWSPTGMWVMAQMKGITSHSLLVLGMTPKIGGYHLTVIDSNSPLKIRTVKYFQGDRSLQIGGETFVPYAGFHGDFDLIRALLQHHCGKAPL